MSCQGEGPGEVIIQRLICSQPVNMKRTAILLLLFSLMFDQAPGDYRSGLSVRLENEKRSVEMLSGSSVNISYVLWLRRGGTGLLGVTGPRLLFSVEGGDRLLSVPQSLDIQHKEEEETCQASQSKHRQTEEILLRLSLPLTARTAGQVRIRTLAQPDVMDTTSATLTINIIKSNIVQCLIYGIGWLYFFLWSFSFYPQIILNFKTSSVQGLSLDFVILNVIGFALYSIFNIEMYLDPTVQSEYLRGHPDGVLPVQLNDVVFSLHALLAASLTLAQCFLLGGQRLTQPARLYLSLITILVMFIISLHLVSLCSWLTCLYLLSYLKLGITFVKFLPQVVTNYRQKSTKGWSVGNVVLDLAGGLASLLQMILVALNSSDWTSLTGDLTKLGLSLVSLGFDLVFLLQHFVLYKDREPYQQIQ